MRGQASPVSICLKPLHVMSVITPQVGMRESVLFEMALHYRSNVGRLMGAIVSACLVLLK